MIYVTGDCHGDFSRFDDYRFTKLTKNDYMIICGDFGGIWDSKRISRHEKKNLKELSKKPFTTLFVDGNHDNFERLYNYPIIDWNGGRVHKISSSILHLIRGEIYEIDNKKFFVFGGAESHDIKDGILNETDNYKIDQYEEAQASYRIRNINWWDLEMPIQEEFKNGLVNLDKNNYKVDYIITHCAPTSIQNRINEFYPINLLTNYLENIKNKTDYKKWYFGHYHKNISNAKEKYYCLFDDIIEIK